MRAKFCFCFCCLINSGNLDVNGEGVEGNPLALTKRRGSSSTPSNYFLSYGVPWVDNFQIQRILNSNKLPKEVQSSKSTLRKRVVIKCICFHESLFDNVIHGNILPYFYFFEPTNFEYCSHPQRLIQN